MPMHKNMRFLIVTTSLFTCSAFTSPSQLGVSRGVFRPQQSVIILNSETIESVDDVPSDVEEVEELPPTIAQDTVLSARNEVLYLGKTLSETSPTGVFLSTLDSVSKLSKAIAELEAAVPATLTKAEQDMSVGDWELICTARKPTRGLPSEPTKLSLPFNLPKPPNPTALQDTVRKSVSVVQRIRVSEEDEDVIDRVDNVIEYTPLNIKDVIPEDSPLKAIRGWNVNPLEVSKSKVTLIHKAEVESLTPVYRTKIGLKSVVVTVAGTSQYLEPDGADLLGLNIPSLGDFLNSGTFDTVYVDDDVRICKGSIAGVVDELRVFVRKESSIETLLDESYEAPVVESDDTSPTSPQSFDVNERFEAVSKAVTGVVEAVDTLDKNVRTTVKKDAEDVTKAVEGVRDSIQEVANDVRDVVQDDLKVIGKAVDGVRAAIVGETKEEDVIENEVITGEIVDEVSDEIVMVDSVTDEDDAMGEDEDESVVGDEAVDEEEQVEEETTGEE